MKKHPLNKRIRSSVPTETVRKRFGRETGWRWVEDQHPTPVRTPWQYGAYSYDDTPFQGRYTAQQLADMEDE